MLKRFFALILLFSCAGLLIGCDKVKELTDDETRLIAEYAAEMLLKYDLNYTDRIAEGDEEAAKKATEETTEPEEDVQESVSTEEDTQDSSEGRNVGEMATIENETAETVGTESDIAKIAGISGVTITYKDYMVTSHYPDADTEEGQEAISLDASDGYQLLVVRFRIANKAEDTVNVSLLDKELDYRVVCNGNKAAVPMLTILVEDLSTLETTVNSGEEQEAVLIFQISDDMKDVLESVDLKVHYNDMDNVIKIL